MDKKSIAEFVFINKAFPHHVLLKREVIETIFEMVLTKNLIRIQFIKKSSERVIILQSRPYFIKMKVHVNKMKDMIYVKIRKFFCLNAGTTNKDKVCFNILHSLL